MKSETRQCQSCKQSFVIEPEDFIFYEKIKVPPPTFCPQCRLQRRLFFRNERTFYKRSCDLCSKNIISSYPVSASFPVYCIKCWWSDRWDPRSYARDFDFSRTFSEQFQELLNAVPALAVMNDDGVGSINCEYTYDTSFSKNCYLIICTWYAENVFYSFHVDYTKEVVDCSEVWHSELCYECVDIEHCHKCSYSVFLSDCYDCIFGYDLKNCSECILCVGLRNKRYCIRNKQYSPEEYAKKKQEMHLDKYEFIEQYKQEFREAIMKFPRKYAHLVRSVNSSGELLFNCKNAKSCFFYFDLEDCKYMVIGDGGKDTYDCNNTGKTNLCYEGGTPDNSYGNVATLFCWKCNRAEYSNNCHSCNNVFGCTALKHASYAILNKVYSKDEYLGFREKIVKHMIGTGEWGEFLHPKLSPFAYNESAAQEWFPLTREEAENRGYSWKEREKREHVITLASTMFPQTITQVPDSILNEVVGCAHDGKCNEQCTSAFRVIPQELEFYRKMILPLPRLCPNCRHYQRLMYRNPPKLWHRKCICAGEKSDNGVYRNQVEHFHGTDHCPNEFETSYAPERPEIVYCESCYNAEVV